MDVNIDINKERFRFTAHINKESVDIIPTIRLFFDMRSKVWILCIDFLLGHVAFLWYPKTK